MEVKVGIGIGELIFGMHRSQVEKLIGKPDKEAIDDEDEMICQFNSLKSRISFYSNEGGRLGYIRCSSAALTHNGQSIIGEKIDTVLKLFEKATDISWEVEEYDSMVVYTNENGWLSLQSEYDVVTQVELGVPFLNDDEYNWPPLKDSPFQLKVVYSKQS